MNSVQRLAGKVAIVTGGGDGIGKGICELFADEGARLAVIDMNDQTGSATVEEIRKAGGEAAFFHCDVGIEEDIAAMVEAVTGAFGGIDILINNAGVHLTKGTLETSTAEWERCHAVDLRGVWLCTKYCAPSMIARGKGAVVNISSVQGVQTMKNFAGYASAKAGVIGLTRNMALDLAPHVRVTPSCPAISGQRFTTVGSSAPGMPRTCTSRWWICSPWRGSGRRATWRKAASTCAVMSRAG